ncbi:MAG: hypothetical protein JW809_10675 [Pirellulales bacterium]|nr:hypothetical protein [Pirellulales bacterium]
MRKTIVIVASLAGVVGSMTAAASAYEGPRWYVGPARATTPAEGFAQGVAAVLRARGEAALDASLAARHRAEAQRIAIENQRLQARVFAEIQQTHRERRAAERAHRPSGADLMRLARENAPRRLSPGELHAVTGKITWPVLLREEMYRTPRMIIEAIFARRAVQKTLSADDLAGVRGAAETMLDGLRQQIRQVAAADFMASKNFLASLVYESRLPPT